MEYDIWKKGDSTKTSKSRDDDEAGGTRTRRSRRGHINMGIEVTSVERRVGLSQVTRAKRGKANKDLEERPNIFNVQLRILTCEGWGKSSDRACAVNKYGCCLLPGQMSCCC